MTDKTRQPGYDAVIPAHVRYDPELKDKAKLLYGEIRALASREGYCWASNSYFCQLYGISESCLQAHIKSLADRGHIVTEVIRDEESKAVIERRIWVDRAKFAARDPDAPPPDFWGTPPPDFRGTPPPEIWGNNITSRNSTSKKAPLKSPRGGRRKKEPLPDWEPDRFARFWDAYPKTQSNANQKKADARRAWNRLKPDAALMAYMGRYLDAQKKTRQWREGVGVPYASTWINAFGKDELPDLETLEALARSEQSSARPTGWADDPEVMHHGG